MLWQRKGVHYDFGMPMETQMLSYAGDRLLKGVLDSKRMAGGRYMLRRSAAGASDMLRAGGFYCRHGLLDRIGDLQGEETTWDFTQLGKSRLVMSQWLRVLRPAIHPRKGIALEDMARFELLAKLQAEGWSMALPKKGTKRQQLAYDGGDRVWYSKPTATTVSQAYLMALLSYPEHKQPVEPFRGDAYYEHIMSGKPWVQPQTKRREKTMFDVEAGEQGNLERSHGSSFALGDGETAAVDEPPAASRGKGGSSPSGSESDSSKSSASSSGSPSCSGTPRTSASSCSSSSSGTSTAAAAIFRSSAAVPMAADAAGLAPSIAAPMPPPLPPPALGQAAAAAEGGASEARSEPQPKGAAGARSGGGSVVATTFFWRGFRFTRTWRKDQQPLGIEVACYRHDPSGTSCRRPRSFAAHGGEERTLRLLKTWCLGAATTKDYESHKALPDVDEPLDDAELEARPLPELDFDPAARAAKRLRKNP